MKIDGNSVDVDVEMAKMSQNAMKIVALSQIIARKYAGLRAVITETAAAAHIFDAWGSAGSA